MNLEHTFLAVAGNPIEGGRIPLIFHTGYDGRPWVYVVSADQCALIQRCPLQIGQTVRYLADHLATIVAIHQYADYATYDIDVGDRYLRNEPANNITPLLQVD